MNCLNIITKPFNIIKKSLITSKHTGMTVIHALYT